MDDFELELEQQLKNLSVNKLSEEISNQVPNDNPDHNYLMSRTDDIILRVGYIQDPTVSNYNIVGSAPLDITGVINRSEGKCCIRLSDGTGGYCMPNSTGSQAGLISSSYNAFDKNEADITDTNTKACVDLIYPIMWVGPTNWMGINYLPPKNAKVIIGLGKHGQPYMLGYLNGNPRQCTPTLEPGEICIKGYGKNYIVSKWSNKLLLQTEAKAGDVDMDDVTREKTAENDCTCSILLDADNGAIFLTAGKNQLIISATQGIALSTGGQAVIQLNDNQISTSAESIATNGQVENKNTGADHANMG